MGAIRDMLERQLDEAISEPQLRAVEKLEGQLQTFNNMLERAREERVAAEAIAERWKQRVDALEEQLAAARQQLEDQAHDLKLCSTDYDNVWRWIGDGCDHPESLTCPVIMDAEELRALLWAGDLKVGERMAGAADVEHCKDCRHYQKSWVQDPCSSCRQRFGRPTCFVLDDGQKQEPPAL